MMKAPKPDAVNDTTKKKKKKRSGLPCGHSRPKFGCVFCIDMARGHKGYLAIVETVENALAEIEERTELIHKCIKNFKTIVETGSHLSPDYVPDHEKEDCHKL